MTRCFLKCLGLAALLGLVGAGCTEDPNHISDAGDAAYGGMDATAHFDAGEPRDATVPPDADSAGAGVDADILDAAMDASPMEPDASSHDAGRHDASELDAAPVDASEPVDATPAPGQDSSIEMDAGLQDSGPPPDEDTFTKRVVASGLEAPWEIAWGPDDRLWITERAGKRVIRMNPATGATTIALTVADAYQASGQDGVLGMALDPRLGQASGGDYVYLAYTYDADPSGAVDRRAKIVRFSYDADTQQLGSPLTLLEELPASGDHNSGRLAYGSDNNLYYTIGDQGHNQFDNMCLTVRAQDLPSQSAVDQEDWSTYQGKILRLELDGSIPADNPLLAGARSHIYSYGHRNAQGIVFGPDGKLYASEQGPKTDDEINWIRAGKNYGWPNVAGFRDDMAYVYGNWSASIPEPCANLTFSDYGWPSSVPETRESEWSDPEFTPPLMTFYTVDDGFDFTDPACSGGNEFICWPTIAPSSLDIYVPGTTGLQTWGTSLLVTSLKTGSVFRVKLNATGEGISGPATELFKTTNRYRDLAIAPDKRTFYVVTDSDGSTSGPTSGATQMLDNRGAVLEFKFTP